MRLRLTDVDVRDLARGCRALAAQALQDAERLKGTSQEAHCRRVPKLYEERARKLERLASDGKVFALGPVVRVAAVYLDCQK